MDELIPIAELLPHSEPMLLLNRVLESGEESIVCEVVVRSDGLFDTAGQVPALLGLEYMAQSVSAYSGLVARHKGRPVRVGFLLGTRHFETNVASFSCGAVLKVTVNCVLQGNDGMAAFMCTVTGEGVQQSARLSVFEPSNPQTYLQRGSRL